MRIDSQITLLNIPEEFKNWFIEQLTFDNPVYLEAKKRGRYTRGLPEKLKMYRSLPNGITIPRGYLQIVEDAIIGQGYGVSIKDNRTLLAPIFTKSKIELRPYQEEAKYLLLSHPNGVLVAPAASGKTIIGLDIFASLHQKTLWLTHTNRLAKQVIDRIEGVFDDIDRKEVGIIGGGKFTIGDRITIGMVPTLIRREVDLPTIGRSFGLIILDECLTAGTEILMADGKIKKIEEVSDGDVTPFGKISHKFSRKTDSTIVLRSSAGKLEGTPSHLLPIIKKSSLKINKLTNFFHNLEEKDVIFEKMENIDKGDMILLQENFCHVERYNIGEKKARMLALIACDGHIEKHGYCVQVGITKDKEWFLNEMLTNTSFVTDNLEVKTSNCTRGDLIIRSYSKELIAYLNQFIPMGSKSYVIRVPEIIMNGNLDDIKNYLQVVFDTEGAVTDQIVLTMASHEFIKGIVFLLRKFGIVGRIIPDHNGYLRISMAGYDAFLFWKKIGFSMKRKQDLLTNLIYNAKKFRRMVSFRGINYRCVNVISKKVLNEEKEVYDFTTDQHLFIANGVLSSNCHHLPASTFLKVTSYFSSFYAYALTATPYRRDGLEDMMFAAIGLANSTVERKELQSVGKIITPTVYVRPVPSAVIEDNNYSEILREVLPANPLRTQLIVSDVVKEARAGNFCIVICMRKAYAELLLDQISKYWDRVGIATGDHTRKHNDEQINRLEKSEISVLITTFELLGEGFDVPKLNRGFIATPFRERARVEQAVGRIQRPCEGKKDSILYDYVDVNIGILKNQFINRALTYRKLGMKIITI